MNTENKKTKMKAGASYAFKPNEPAMFVTGAGNYTYIWVGNDFYEDKKCFATVSGPKTLERFAVNILKALKSNKLK